MNGFGISKQKGSINKKMNDLKCALNKKNHRLAVQRLRVIRTYIKKSVFCSYDGFLAEISRTHPFPN